MSRLLSALPEDAAGPCLGCKGKHQLKALPEVPNEVPLVS